MRWLLPEYFADVLPKEAARLECLRRKILDLFQHHGFSFVMPPLLEYLESLLTGSGRDLDLKTFKLVDQLSGKTMGLRADITPQVARMDAHLLNQEGITRLCYCGSVVHTKPSNIFSGRELQQIGAEIYGALQIDADLSILDLVAKVFLECQLELNRVDLNHLGIFNALCQSAQIEGDLKNRLTRFLRLKDAPSLFAVSRDFPPLYQNAFRALLKLYGEPEDVLSRARESLTPLNNECVFNALNDLAWIVRARPDLPFSIDLADLAGYHYHTGLSFSAYTSSSSLSLAHGGRYDGVGAAFGRNRAATGFSMDLRLLAKIAQTKECAECLPIWVKFSKEKDAALQSAICNLRKSGKIVIEALEEETIPQGALHLVFQNGAWVVQQ